LLSQIKRYNVLYISLDFIKDTYQHMDKRHLEKETGLVNRFIEYKEFIKDKHVEFVIKKTERIVYGVYLLSNFIPRTEALHGDLKRTSHALLRVVTQFPQTTGIKTSLIDEIHAHLQYLSSLLSLSCLSGYISESNIEIFKTEINYLHKHVEELSTKSVSETGQLQVKQDMFVVGQTKQAKAGQDTPTSIKDIPSKRQPKMSFIKDKKPLQKPHLTASPKQTEIPKGDREEKILQVIRDRGTVSIKDISSVIFDCSEKTIQRMLQALIDKGQVRKEGERRWAKYKLV
jgi:hypothetical protein